MQSPPATRLFPMGRVNGLDLSQAAAVANLRALQGRLRLPVENEKVADRLAELLGVVDCTGKHAHDANVVAAMLVHEVNTVVTSNTKDFARFRDHMRAVPLAG